MVLIVIFLSSLFPMKAPANAKPVAEATKIKLLELTKWKLVLE